LPTDVVSDTLNEAGNMSRSMARRWPVTSGIRWRAMAVATAFAVSLSGKPSSAAGQAAIGVQEFSPFVIAVVPVVRNGAVGGISIDADGVLRQAKVADVALLRAAWRDSLPRAGGALAAVSPLRKVSLRRLERAIGERQRRQQSIDPPMQFLAGLQRVQYVFVYPEASDVVLAGPAEGWQANAAGEIVGTTTGRPVMHLADLLLAWRALSSNAARAEPISCSIDPKPDGLARVRELTSAGLEAGEASLAKLEQALGPQTIRINGVPPGSHIARVMLAADFRMKRLAMGFEKPPIGGLPGYLKLMKVDSGTGSEQLLPRWWLAPRYGALARNAEGTAWELQSPGVECLTENSRLEETGELAQTGAAGSAARKWADNMTDRYDALSERITVFAKLRNAMDLAVVAALLVRHDLPDRAGWSFPTLSGTDIAGGAEFAVPRTVDSRASFVRKGRNWIVSVSGGVEIDPWSLIEGTAESPTVAEARAAAAPGGGLAWWWD
jgi:hypothetical protein